MDKELARFSKKLQHIEEAICDIQAVAQKVSTITKAVKSLKTELKRLEEQFENGNFVQIHEGIRIGRRAKWGVKWTDFILEFLATRGPMFTAEIIHSILSSHRIPEIVPDKLSSNERRRLSNSIRVALNDLSEKGSIKKISSEYNAPWALAHKPKHYSASNLRPPFSENMHP